MDTTSFDRVENRFGFKCLKNSTSYSGRRSSTVEAAFFIEFLFTLGGGSCSDEPDHVATLGKGYKKKAIDVRAADDHFTKLADGVVRVITYGCGFVIENSDRFVEAHSVLQKVRRRLLIVPIEPRGFMSREAITIG